MPVRGGFCGSWVSSNVLHVISFNREYAVMIDSNKFILKCQDLKISGNTANVYIHILGKNVLVITVHWDKACFAINDDNEHIDEWLECFYRAERIL